MANEEHLARLKQGVEAWNAWRAKNRRIRPDLTGRTSGIRGGTSPRRTSSGRTSTGRTSPGRPLQGGPHRGRPRRGPYSMDYIWGC